MPYKFLYKNKKPSIFIIKKKFFSFLKTNELKMSVFNIKRRLLLGKAFFMLTRTKKLSKVYKLTNRSMYDFFKNFRNIFSRNSKNYIYNKLFINEDLFRHANILTAARKGKKKKYGRELRISRVKFKPGYQRLWRHFRLAFAESVNFRYIYQQQLTKYFTKFYRSISREYLSQNENELYKVVIYSRLVPDLSIFNLFFNNSLIFLNSKILKRKDIFLYKNDFIQLEISNWYYICMRASLGDVHLRHNKFKRLVYRKSLSGRYKLMKQRKQRSNYTPNWIFNTVFDFSDIKNYLEVDFFTLSAFIVYDFNYFLYSSPKDLFVTRHNIYRLYN
jgi:hypothetical protein